MEILQTRATGKQVTGKSETDVSGSERSPREFMSEEEAVAQILDSWSGPFDKEMKKAMNAYEKFRESANLKDLDRAIKHLEKSEAGDEFVALTQPSTSAGSQTRPTANNTDNKSVERSSLRSVSQSDDSNLTSATGTFVSESAGYSNVLYTYDIGPDGAPTNFRLLIQNSNQTAAGKSLNEISMSNGKPNLLLLANGANAVNANSALQFKNGQLLVDGKTFGGAHYFSTTQSGSAHFRITSEGSGGLKVEIEDLPDLGDRDFNDLVIQVGPKKASSGTEAPGNGVPPVILPPSVESGPQSPGNGVPPVVLPPSVEPIPTPGGGDFVDPSAFGSTISLSSLENGRYTVENGVLINNITNKFVGSSPKVEDGEYLVNQDGVFRSHNGSSGLNWFGVETNYGKYRTGLDINGILYSQEDLIKAGVEAPVVSRFSLDPNNSLFLQSVTVDNGNVFIDEGSGLELIGKSYAIEGQYRLNDGLVQRQFVEPTSNEAHWINVKSDGLFVLSNDYSYEKLTNPTSQGGLGVSTQEIFLPVFSTSRLAEGSQFISVGGTGLVSVDGAVQFSSNLPSGSYFINESAVYRQFGNLYIQTDKLTNKFMAGGQGLALNSSGQVANSKAYSYQELLGLGIDKNQIEINSFKFDQIPNSSYINVLANGEVYSKSSNELLGITKSLSPGNYYKESSSEVFRQVNDETWVRIDNKTPKNFMINQRSWSGSTFGSNLTYDNLVNDLNIPANNISLEFIPASRFAPNIEYQIDENSLVRLDGLVIGESVFVNVPATIKRDDAGNLMRMHNGEWLKASSITGNFETTEENGFNALIEKGITKNQIDLPFDFIYKLTPGGTYSISNKILYVDQQPTATVEFPDGRYFVKDRNNVYQEFFTSDNSSIWLPIHKFLGKYLVNTPDFNGKSYSLNDLINLGIPPKEIIQS